MTRYFRKIWAVLLISSLLLSQAGGALAKGNLLPNAPSELLPPVLQTPGDGATVNDNMPVFTWDASTGANEYQIQVDESNTFSAPLWIDQTLSETSFTPDPILLNGTYYWQVRSGDGSGGWSVWSAYRTLTINDITPPAVPSLTSPDPGVFINNLRPTFTWGAVTGASQYTIQVNLNNNNWNNPQINQTVSVTSFTPGADLSNHIYYWRVRAGDLANNWSAYSASRTFTIDTIAPAVPALTAPNDGLVTNNNKPTFTWSSVTGASKYQIQVDNDGFADPLLVDEMPTGTSYTPLTALPDGTLSWRVQAIDAAGNLSGWSTVWSFTIDTVLPATPILSAPTDGFITNQNTPTFTWGAADGASKYQIQVDNDGFVAPLLVDQMPTGTSYTPLTALPDGTLSWRVQAIDAAGNLSGWSTVWSLVVDTTALGAPTLIAPLDGAFTNDTTPAFSWNAVTDAAGYQIQVDNESGFADPLIYDQLTVATSDTPATPLPTNVLLYWHVRTRDAASNWSAYSAFRSFTIDTLPPAVPVLISPNDGASTNVKTPAFTWGAAAGASQYRIQVDDSLDLLSPVITELVSSPSFTPVSALGDGIYYWHVQAIDAAGNTSLYSASRSFTVDTVLPAIPILSVPTNGFITNNNKPTFTWSVVGDASKYQIQVDNNGFVAPLLVDQMPTGTSYTPLTTLPDGTLSWRVQAIDAAGNLSGWSTVWSLVVDTTALGAPTLVAPLDGAFTNDPTPAFSWNAVTGAAEYQFQVDDDPLFGSPNYDKLTVATSDTPATPLPTNVLLYWHVRTKDGANNWSVYSPSRSFTIDTLPPAVPVLTAPENGATIGNNKPTFTWNASTGASQYRIQVDDSSNLLSPVITELVSSPSFTPGTALSDTTYYWRVQAIDAAGNLSGWSTARSFVVDSTLPAAPALISPADGLVTSDSIPTFTWSVSDGAIQTILQVDESNTFSVPLVNVTVGGTSFTWGTSFADGSYFWRARVLDGAGNQSDWSAVRGFTIDTVPPGVPTLLTPGIGEDMTDSTPTFTWTKPSGASHYLIQVGVGASFTNLVVSQIVDQETYTVPVPLSQGLYSWHVRAFDAADNWSLWSDPRRELTIFSFVVPFFQEGFESGGLGTGWTTIIKNEGRVRVANSQTIPLPGAINSGSYSLFLDDGTPDVTPDGTNSTAAAVLTADLYGARVATLSFNWRGFASANSSSDGVYISDDYGSHWCRILQFDDPQYTYKAEGIDLVAEAKTCLLILNDHFQIKFQFQGKYGILDGANADGYGIDDIQLVGLKHVSYLPLVRK